MKKLLLSIIALFLTLSLCACNKIDTTKTDDYSSFYNKSSDIQAMEESPKDKKTDSVEYEISRQDNS